MEMQPKRLVPSGLLILLAIALILTTAMAAASWYQVAGLRDRESPLRITSCTVDSYTPGVLIKDNSYTPGTPQAECQRLYAGTGDFHSSVDPIVVAGQVCLEGDTEVAYELAVKWRLVESPAEFTALQVPISYLPGCGEPYVFNFVVPRQLESLVADLTPATVGQSLGRWRLVGIATPVDAERYVPYQWDITGSFTLIFDGPPSREPDANALTP